MSAGRSDTSRNLILGGGIALAVAPFLPWASVFLLGDLNLLQLLRITGTARAYGWALIVLGGVTVIFATTKPIASAKQLAIPVGGVGGGVILLYYIQMLHTAAQLHNFAHVSYGPVVAIAGCGAMLIGGLRRT